MLKGTLNTCSPPARPLIHSKLQIANCTSYGIEYPALKYPNYTDSETEGIAAMHDAIIVRTFFL